MKRQPTPTPGRAQLRNLGSLITYRDTGSEHCLGYLLSFEGHGVFEPDLGRIEVTPEEANAHNRALSQAEIQGLDQNCQVGQGGYFYLKDSDGHCRITTWTGDPVAASVLRQGPRIRFQRNGKTYAGTSRKGDDLIFIKRVA